MTTSRDREEKGIDDAMSRVVEVVESVRACERALRRLSKEPIVAADGEGINLSRTGPLTLLQIGTASGRVYLFDILREPRMFSDGGLGEFLENESIVKVMHSSKNDGEALFWQFGVTLREVFDTQVAQMILDRADGRRYPPRLKLADVVTVHCPEKSGIVELEKNSIQTKWNKTEGEYWAQRPLTKEMKDYASNDVIVLIPEVYESQISLLEQRHLMESFISTIERELRSTQNAAVQELLRQETRETIQAVLLRFASTAPKTIKYADIVDADVLSALSHLRSDEVQRLGLPALIMELKVQQMKAKLEDIDRELRQKGNAFEANAGTCGFVRACAAVRLDEEMTQLAIRLQERIDAIVIEDIQKKYKVSTPIVHLAEFERKVLARKLRPTGENDPSIHPVCLSLYWKIKLQDLEDNIQKYKDDPDNYKVSEGYVKVLRFYLSGPVPADLKSKGSEFLRTLQDVGLIARPARAQRYRRRQYDDFEFSDFY